MGLFQDIQIVERPKHNKTINNKLESLNVDDAIR